MKKIMILTVAMVAVFLSACSQPMTVEGMLEDPDTREKVFSAIMEDQEMMTGFMDQMMASEQGRMMMEQHEGWRGQMMQGGHMMNMMHQNPEFMNQMMQDGPMMARMMQMMQQNGMMSEECLQSTRRMMEEQGMDIEDDMDRGMGGNRN